MSASRRIFVMFIAVLVALGLAGCGGSGTKSIGKSCDKGQTTVDVPLDSTTSSPGGGSYVLTTDASRGADLTGSVGVGETVPKFYVGSFEGLEHKVTSNLQPNAEVKYSFSATDYTKDDAGSFGSDHVTLVRLCVVSNGKTAAAPSAGQPGKLVKGSSATVGVKDANGNVNSYDCRSDLSPITLPIGQKHEFDGSVLSVSEVRDNTYSKAQQSVTVTLKLNAHQTVPAFIVETDAHKQAPTAYAQTALGISLGAKGQATFKLDPSVYADNYVEEGIISITFCVGAV